MFTRTAYNVRFHDLCVQRSAFRRIIRMRQRSDAVRGSHGYRIYDGSVYIEIKTNDYLLSIYLCFLLFRPRG